MLRRWQFAITLERMSGIALHLQIVQAITAEIQRSRLLPGAPLPGSRVLAEELGVNRKTVIAAYEELTAQGWIETEAKRGVFVSRNLPTPNSLTPSESLVESGATLTAPALIESDSPCNAPSENATSFITFTDGVPDSRLIPYDVLSRAYRHALVTSARANKLAYGDPRGMDILRNVTAEMLRMERGLNVKAENICVVRGSQMGIYLAARALVRPGDNIVFEQLTYPPARAAFRSCGANILSISLDGAGMCIDELEQLCSTTKIRAVFTTPHHQFPTTAMLSMERRLRLLELSAKHNFTIVEDDYDHEFHFDNRPMLPLASLGHEGKVIHIGSLSKVLAPGLRLGYVAASTDVINRCASEVMLIDRQGNSLTELAVAELMVSGEIKRHIRRALKVYKARRNHAISTVREFITDVEFDIPPGGLALWLRAADHINISQLTADANALGVGITPGSQFADEGEVHGFRIGYANLEIDEFSKGVTVLAKAFRHQKF